MKVRALIVMAAVAGCGETSPLVCIDSAQCGAGGQCIDHFCASSDLTCSSGLRYHESAGEKAGECTGGGSGGGSGSGGDGGGMLADPIETLEPGEIGQAVNASDARDDITPSCATNQQGRDVMFEITVPTGLTRLYVDTYQTTFDVVLAIYEGSCATITATKELGCVAAGALHACDTRSMQWSQNVRAGVHCIVVDQAGAGTASIAHVRGIVGPPAITAEAGVPTTGTTCAHDAFVPGGFCAVANGPDEVWFFMGCSGAYTAITPVGWPGDIEARTETVQYDCNVGETGANFTLAKPGPVWLIAHQGSGACGTLSVDVF